jgi:hypothetical protein
MTYQKKDRKEICHDFSGKKKCSIFFGLAVGIINFSSGTCPETGYIRISHCYLSASMFFFTEAFGIETSAVEAVNHFESF